MPNSAETVLERHLPLKLHLREGRYGATMPAAPGVRLWIRHPLSIATIIARRNRGSALSAALHDHYGAETPAPGGSVRGQEIALQWCGEEQYFAIAEGRGEGELYQELKERLRGVASVSDQSHGRVVIAISGGKARTVLAKGSGVDFHPRAFPLGAAAATQMAHIGVHVCRTGEDVFELSLFRGFCEHFWEWLTEQAEEFGYEVV